MDLVLRLLRWLVAVCPRSSGLWMLGAGVAIAWALLGPLIRLGLATDVPGLLAETAWIVALGGLAVGVAWLHDAEPLLRALAGGHRMLAEIAVLAVVGYGLLTGTIVLTLIATPVRVVDLRGLPLPSLTMVAHLVGVALVVVRLPIPPWSGAPLFLTLTWLVPALDVGRASSFALDASRHLEPVGSNGGSVPMNVLGLAPIAGLFVVSALLMSPHSRGK